VKRVAIGAFLALVTSQMTVAAQARDYSLASVAAALGYTYAYLGPEDAVALSRPGVTIVIRPGERLYDVNDDTEAIDGPAPRFERSDLLVSDAFVVRLRQIAQRYPVQPGDRTVTAVTKPLPGALLSQANEPSTAQATGAIGDLSVRQVPGTQKLAVSGKAPPNLPITLTLVGAFSAEIPDVVLSRTTVTSDASGSFEKTLSIAPGYFRGALLTLVASSVSGVTSASEQLEAKAPNGTTPIPADEVPKSDR
jgi:hypothetical protein